MQDVQGAARMLGRQLHVLPASVEAELPSVFGKLVQQRDGALIVASDPFFGGRRGLLVALAMRYGVPTIYERRDFPDAGASSGTVTNELTRIASLASILVGFSRGPDLQTCRCCSRRNSSS